MQSRSTRAAIPTCRLLTAIAILSTATGCQVGPDYAPPDSLPAQPAWAGQSAASENGYGLQTGEPNLKDWWIRFEDPILNDLIARATENNRDLKLAAARLREARLRLGAARGEYFPDLDGSASYTKRTRSENTNDTPTSASGETDIYQAGFDATWEIDLFGRIARLNEASEAALASAVEERRDVLVTLQSDVAQAYIDVRLNQARLSLTKANLDAQQASLELAQQKFDAGLVPQADVRRAQTVRGTTDAQLSERTIDLYGALDRLSVLLGEAPGPLREELLGTKQNESPIARIPTPPATIALGVPADLMQARPDLRRAERQLAEAFARIGVAEADLYPRLRLIGSFDWESIELGDLFDPTSIATSIGPSVSWNLFDGGRVRKLMQIEDARAEQALYRYEQAVLEASREVEAALTRYVEQQRRRAALAGSVHAAKEAEEDVLAMYDAGLTDYLIVLDAQRSRLSVEDQAAVADAQIADAAVALIKALGGAWRNVEADTTPLAQIKTTE